MLRRVLCLVPLSLLLSCVDAQKPTPTSVYMLHAQKATRSAYLEMTLLQRLPDQALLVLVPQQNGKWLIKRITAWDTSGPKEESLTFDGESPRIGKSHLEELKVDPTGTYAIIRLKTLVMTSQNRTVITLKSFWSTSAASPSSRTARRTNHCLEGGVRGRFRPVGR